MSSPPHDTRAVAEALGAIIEGTSVTRSRHDLTWEGRSLAEQFRRELIGRGFVPLSVAEATVAVGERAPAFYLEGGTAYFGWVFWEKFTQNRRRKLFGSVVRNAKGDWLIQISARQTTPVYVNLSRTLPMEIDLLSSL